jgi:hypothetical protein
MLKFLKHALKVIQKPAGGDQPLKPRCECVSNFRPPKLAMPDKTYLVRFRPSEVSSHVVIAASAEIHGEHLTFLKSDGRLAALFLLEIVESWSECDSRAHSRGA